MKENDILLKYYTKFVNVIFLFIASDTTSLGLSKKISWQVLTLWKSKSPCSLNLSLCGLMQQTAKVSKV